MKNTKMLGLMLLASGIVALIAACASQMGGEPSTGAAVPIDNDDIGGVVTERERPGSRRLGDRRDPRSSDSVRQDGRHRRSGTLRRTRSAESQLRPLGAWVRAGRFAESESSSRQDSQPQGGRRAERSRGGAILSGDLLVLDAEDSRARASSAARGNSR